MSIKELIEGLIEDIGHFHKTINNELLIKICNSALFR